MEWLPLEYLNSHVNHYNVFQIREIRATFNSEGSTQDVEMLVPVQRRNFIEWFGKNILFNNDHEQNEDLPEAA
jgi:hypothetical protein